MLADGRGELVETWVGFILPVGLDHRCVQCKIRFTPYSIIANQKRLSLKGWKPYADENDDPRQFHDEIIRQRALHDANSSTFLESKNIFLLMPACGKDAFLALVFSLVFWNGLCANGVA